MSEVRYLKVLRPSSIEGDIEWKDCPEDSWVEAYGHCPDVGHEDARSSSPRT